MTDFGYNVVLFMFKLTKFSYDLLLDIQLDTHLAYIERAFCCSKDKRWTHLLDNCSLWQPKQDKINRDYLELSDTF